MLLLNLTCLALSATMGATHPVVQRADSTEGTVLTTEILARMATFWQTFMKEPDSVKGPGRQANQESPSLTLEGGKQVQLPGVVNMVAMATKYPSVAADFKTAKLTPQEWEQDRSGLFAATLSDAIGTGQPAAGASQSVVSKNIEFLHAHQKELDALKATGMWFPQLQQGGGGMGNAPGGDLDP